MTGKNENDQDEPANEEFDRFQNLTRDLLKVPKKDVDERRRAEANKENPA